MWVEWNFTKRSRSLLRRQFVVRFDLNNKICLQTKFTAVSGRNVNVQTHFYSEVGILVLWISRSMLDLDPLIIYRLIQSLFDIQ